MYFNQTTMRVWVFSNKITAILIYIVTRSALGLQQDGYVERKDCKDRSLQLGPATISNIVASLTDCACQCSSLTDCLTFMFSSPSTCHLHKGILDSSCGAHQVQIGAKIYEKFGLCKNGGTFINGTCVCSGGYIGTYCERLAKECGELLPYSYYSTLSEAIIQIQPSPSLPPFTIECDLALVNPINGKPRNYIQRHHIIGDTFNKLWADYRSGFGSFSQKEYWLGNEAIHSLTSTFVGDLVIEMASENWNSIWQQTFYGFRVQDNSAEYRMMYASSGPYPHNSGLGDSLMPVNNTEFCTLDHNNNVDPNVNCGDVRKSGFWFCDLGNKCGSGNPNGKLMKPTDGKISGIYDEVFWNSLLLGDTSPWFVQMWIEI